ncbi:hypothetical protein AVEN_147479-1 [Araneus ventricosus]|uniref:Uncharacterized protein n=1 Tax=Araneus ventricosus TaxID=182803 RepID=A0A4Y2X5D1_ARAVE|nr:hypothetical protein AVEN_147479-1 [Araneus ventricosus]
MASNVGRGYDPPDRTPTPHLQRSRETVTSGERPLTLGVAATLNQTPLPCSARGKQCSQKPDYRGYDREVFFPGEFGEEFYNIIAMKRLLTLVLATTDRASHLQRSRETVAWPLISEGGFT